MINWSCCIEHETDMRRLGATLSRVAGAGVRVALQGELGVGKTTLVRGYLAAAGHDGAVRSPTYTLIEPYTLPGRNIVHWDIYRLGDPEELVFLGVRDLLDGDWEWLVEWPERGLGYLPQFDLSLRLAYRRDVPSGRVATLEAHTERGEVMLAALRSATPPSMRRAVHGA